MQRLASESTAIPVRKRLPGPIRLTKPAHHTCSMPGSPTTFVLLKFSARARLCIRYTLIGTAPPPPRTNALVSHYPLGCSLSAIFVVITRRESQANGTQPPASTRCC